jgi:RNA polymerase sigma factor (sigma-70 family)
MNQVIQYLRELVRAPRSPDATDGELLERFVARRDEAAFEDLLRRHGPMVLSVCRGLLRNPHDADDAFQAAFLVLVRRAASLEKRACLGSWLYGVAYRTALNSRRTAARRRARERRAGAMPKSEYQEQAATERELQWVLREEVSRLPEKYRAPIVLCYLEEKTYEEAARRLGCPKGTLLSRLARGRDKLRVRLVRRGVALSAGGLAAALAENVAPAALPVPLLTATIRSAALVAAGKTIAAGALSPGVAALTEGVLKAMFLTKRKSVAVILLVLAVAGTGLGLLGYRLQAADPPKKLEAAAPAPSTADEPKPEEKGRTEPPGVPLEARLIAKESTYVLDLGGKTPEEFKKAVEEGQDTGQQPQPPVVDLVLEITNKSDKDVKIWFKGDAVTYDLALKGPGAVSARSGVVFDTILHGPEAMTLEAGKAHSIKLAYLEYGFRGAGSRAYWTQSGDYTLTATYKTAVSPVPAGAKDNGNGFGLVTVVSAPVELKVVKKK